MYLDLWTHRFGATDRSRAGASCDTKSICFDVKTIER